MSGVIWELQLMSTRVEQNIVIMAACVPTMRPFFHRVWRRGSSADIQDSATTDPFESNPMRRSRTGHRRVGSKMDVALNDLDVQDDAASRESQQGIVRTVEVSMDWKAHPDGEVGNSKHNVIPRAITESER